tara:strand:- start:35 stop:979 length:945 start_codon:yes stop_codon:yes gene_type:complete
MSYLQGKKNIYSLISSSVIDYIKDTSSINNKLLTDSGGSGTVFLGIPNNLVSSTTLLAQCGNGNDTAKCTKCLNNFGITDDMMTGDKYVTNLDVINKIRKNECFGVCSCNISNVSLETNLIFSTGVNINSNDINNSDIVNSIKDKMTSVNKSTSSGKHYNWLWALMGVSGVVIAATTPTISKDVEDSLKKTVSNIAMMYSNTINQLITSSQEMVIQGTGVRVHNISMSSIQDITMTASQQDCGQSGTCTVTNINDLTNNLMASLTKNISEQFTGMFSYAFKQNKTLIIAAGVFITLTMFLWFFLLFKKAASKRQ